MTGGVVVILSYDEGGKLPGASDRPPDDNGGGMV
jgi:hypothetical protein